jgi:predicted Zn-dependent protease
MAGYDPYEAINFWNRMSETKNATDQPPVFLSTHPSDQARIEAIKKYLADLKKN